MLVANLLDFLFPKKCVLCKKIGSFLCANCFTKFSFDAKSLCLVCNKPSFNGLTHPSCRNKFAIDGCFSALSYNAATKKLIYSFKYKPFLTGLQGVLSDLFYESLIQKEELMALLTDKKWSIVPIPLSDSRLRKRGYNQSEILAKELGKKFSIPAQNLLKRAHDTKTQVGLKMEERRQNIKGAFEISSQLSVARSQKLAIGSQNIFLVDDVVTTGSTLLEAANVLKRNGVKKVFALTLARD
jgi:competence protein ComFC